MGLKQQEVRHDAGGFLRLSGFLRLNRTSVGLKLVLNLLTQVGALQPQSNQRGIETETVDEVTLGAEERLNRTSVGLKPLAGTGTYRF